MSLRAMSHNSGQVAFVRAPVARLNLQARFVGMAGAGRVTLKLTTSEDNMQLVFTRDFRPGFPLEHA